MSLHHNGLHSIYTFSTASYIKEEINLTKSHGDTEIIIRTIARTEEILDTIEIIQMELINEFDSELNDFGYILAVRLVNTMGHWVLNDERGQLWKYQLRLLRSFKRNA